MPRIRIENHDISIQSNPGYSLLNNFLQHDVPIHTVCGGHADCGCCRIRVLNGDKGMTRPNYLEKVRLGEHLISEGWRLSCQSYTLRDIVVHVPDPEELDRKCGKK